MYGQSSDRKRLEPEFEELERNAKAASITKCGDESEWKLHLLAEVAIAKEVPGVIASFKLVPTHKQTTDGQSSPGPSISQEVRGAIFAPEAEGHERTKTNTTCLDSAWNRDLKSLSLEPEAKKHPSKKRYSTLRIPAPIPKILPVSRKRPHSEASAEETDNEDDYDEEGTDDDEGETDSDDNDTDGGESSAPAAPPSGTTAGGNNQALPHQKTIDAHDKAASIHGLGAGPHPRGRCVKCVKGNRICVVNPIVGGGNTCYRCAKNKEKCSHQEYVDGQWIRGNGSPAIHQCTQCSDKGSRGLLAECYQADKAQNDKYGKACSQCHMDGTKNACSLKEPPKKRPPKQSPPEQRPPGQAPKRQRKLTRRGPSLK